MNISLPAQTFQKKEEKNEKHKLNLWWVTSITSSIVSVKENIQLKFTDTLILILDSIKTSYCCVVQPSIEQMI